MKRILDEIGIQHRNGLTAQVPIVVIIVSIRHCRRLLWVELLCMLKNYPRIQVMRKGERGRDVGLFAHFPDLITFY